MRQTKTDAVLAAAAAQHEGDEERVTLIESARRFKSSWLELAEALSALRRSESFRRWGYESIEDYASAELHLRKDTVAKLTGSYGFLQRRAPDVLRRDGVRAPIPDYHAVDFLRRAEEQPGAPDDAVASIRKRVIEENAPASAVARQFKSVVFPIDEAAQRARDTAGLRNVATRLRELLEGTRAVPRKLAAEVSAELGRLLEALGEERAA